jgi:hypothetical protein
MSQRDTHHEKGTLGGSGRVLRRASGEQTPRRFSFGGRTIEVKEALDAWLGPDHRYFKLLGSDRACYILRHLVAEGRWELTMYDRTGTIGPRIQP